MARGADLFVVCKNCGSEVSPYVTECPYCGQRVRKRAPKIERGGPAREPRGPGGRREGRAPRPARPRLSRLRPEEIPGLASRGTSRPWATILLVAASFVVYLLATANAVDQARLIVLGPLDGEWWRVFSAPFVHLDVSGGSSWFAGGTYQLATMIAVGTFGWLLERRHGAWAVVAVYVLAGAGGMLAEAALDPTPLAIGSNGLGLGLLAAWAVPDLLAWRRDDDWDGDLLGTAVIAAVLLLMPLAVDGVSAIAGVTGGVAGLLFGLFLQRVRPR